MLHNGQHNTDTARFLTGQAGYAHNLAGDAWHVVFLRSNYAQGRITCLDASRALAMPGVLAVLSAADLRDAGGNLRMPGVNQLATVHERAAFLESSVLADGHVSFCGQACAIVIATSVALARTAAAALVLEIDDSDAAGSEAAEAFAEIRFGQTKPEEDLFVSVSLQQERVYAFPMEPRAALMTWQAQGDRLHAIVATQAPARTRADLAAALSIDEQQIHLQTPDVGGAFGAKASISPEELALALAARHLGKLRSLPFCKLHWASPRSEEFLASMHGRASHLAARLYLDQHHKLSHLSARADFIAGAWQAFSAVVPMRNAMRILPGPYRVGSVDLQGKTRGSHRTAVNIYRGAGRPEAAILMECLMDKAAALLGEDPLHFRLKHLLPSSAMPARTCSGETIDSGDFAALLNRCAERFDYSQARADQVRRRDDGELIGIGIALYLEPCGQGWESARVRLEPNGQVIVASGTSTQGQGHERSFARIAAQALNIPEANIKVMQGDSATCPPGIGALASRSTAIGGSAVLQACQQLLGAWDDANRNAGLPARTLPANAIEITTRYTAPQEAWGSGALMAQIAVCAETGSTAIERLVWIDDAGRLLSPELVKGQLLGGLAQGFGQAMMERIVYDDSGQLLTGSLMDYAIPRAGDMPAVTIESLPSTTAANLLGAKGVGEAGCIGVPAALMGAVRDALSTTTTDLDTVQFPLTPARLWECMNPR